MYSSKTLEIESVKDTDAIPTYVAAYLHFFIIIIGKRVSVISGVSVHLNAN